MSANIYTIENLLIGKSYNSNSINGKIIDAKKDDRAIWYGENLEPYLVEIQSPKSIHSFWRTIAVKVSD